VTVIFIRATLNASDWMDGLIAKVQFEALRRAVSFAGAVYREITTSVIRECELVARNSNVG
jgi:hypothetical protein